MKVGPPHPRRTASGFTLMELVISTALMAFILTAAYACLNAGFSGQRLIEPRVDLFQSARVALDRISADLRCTCPLPKGAPFLGVHRMLGDVSADNLDFATHNYTPQRPGEGDFCEQSLFLEKDPKTGSYSLWRRRNPTLALDPLSGGFREELATGVAGLRLEYYDGLNWYDSWGDPQAGSTKSELATPKPNSRGLPDAVRITLSFENRERGRANRDADAAPPPVLTFATVVRLNVPMPSNSSSTSTGSSDSGPSSTEAAPRL